MTDEGPSLPVEGPRAAARRKRQRRRRRLELGGAAAAFVVLFVGAVAYAATHESDDTRTSVDAAEASTTAATGSPPASSAPTTTAPPTTTTGKPRPPGPESMTLAFAGDLLPHMPLNAQAGRYGQQVGAPYDFHPMFDPMKPILEPADLAICHMEVPLAADQARLSGYPAFGAPAQIIDGAKDAGYDGCSTASNHSLDQGRAGIDATLAKFDQDGMKHTGTARTAEEGAAVTLYDVGGAKVAHLSYAYGFNGYQLPGDAPFAANQIDVARIHAESTRAREAGAQLVVVSLHWGTEYRHEPDQYQRDTAAALLPWPDIDVVIGHHAHVVQPIEQVEGTWVVWGLGNQLANQPEVPRSDGLTAILTAQQQPDGRYVVAGIEAVPTWIEPGSFRILPVVRTLQDPATSGALRDQLFASYDRTATVLDPVGHPGVTFAARP